MKNAISIVQIGCGGTGLWFAKTAAQILCQIMHEKNSESTVEWHLYDPDTVEPRNLFRQPFAGGVGMNKAEFLEHELKKNFRILKLFNVTVQHYPDLFDIESNLAYGPRYFPVEHPTYIVCCVDNNYTREKLENHFIQLSDANKRFTTYINMGVSADGDWIAERIPAERVLPSIFDELTYPDQMLSCAEREERGPVPQTVYSNIMAGANSAHLLIEDVVSDTKLGIRRLLGRDGVAEELHPDSYILERIENQTTEKEVVDVESASPSEGDRENLAVVSGETDNNGNSVSGSDPHENNGGELRTDQREEVSSGESSASEGV